MFGMQCRAKILGSSVVPRAALPKLWESGMNMPCAQLAEEDVALAAELHRYARRIYEKGFSLTNPDLFCISARTKKGMLTNPANIPLYDLTQEDYCEVEDGAPQNHHQKVHQEIYRNHPDINCILTAIPQDIMCFAITGTKFDTKIIPESYVVLQNVKTFPYEAYGDEQLISLAIKPSCNELVFENSCVLCCGPAPLKMYDRIEVLEYSARAVLDAKNVGEIVYIEGDAIRDIIKAFKLPE